MDGSKISEKLAPVKLFRLVVPVDYHRLKFFFVCLAVVGAEEKLS